MPDRRSWLDAHDHALCRGANDPVSEAWRSVAGAVQARARLARHQAITRHVVIRANPEDYNRIVDDLAGVLGREFHDLGRPIVDELVKDLAEIGSSGRPRALDEAEARLRAGVARLGIAGQTSRARVDPFTRATGAAYVLGQREVSTGLGWEVGTDLPDRDAIAGLSSTGLLWVGDAYGDRLNQRRILDVVERTMIRGGLGREEGGRALRAEFGDQFKRSDRYWEMLAATTATRARSVGSLAAMERCGVVTYEYVNPLDERTSDVCRALDGTIYKVKTSVALRDRMVAASSPDEYKAIAPWPRGGDVYTAEGAALYKSGAFRAEDGTLDTAKAKPYLKPSGELAAAGIAIPPLHGHCRSTIEVAEVADLDMSAVDPIGNVEPERTAPPPPPKRPRKKKADAPTETADDWTKRRAAWKAAETACKARKLDVGDVAPSEAVLAELRELAVTYARKSQYLPRGTLDYSEVTRAGKVRALAPGRTRWRALLDDLEASPAAGEAAVARLRADLDALDEFERAYCDAMRAAPYEVHEAEARRWARAINDKVMDRDLPKDVAEELRTVISETIATSYGADTLSILAREGVTVKNQARQGLQRPRAYATPGRGYRGEAPSAHVPKRYALEVAQDEHSVRATTVHELAHCLDSILGGGAHGRAWMARPGLPDAPELWRSTFKAPFEAAKLPLPPMTLPGETRSRFFFAGNWIEPYEARIYNAGGAAPTAAEIADSGPVEYIAMAGSYHRHQVEQLRAELAGEVVIAERGVRRLTATRWMRARAAYGSGYGDGFELLSGQALLREVARRIRAADAPTFRTPADAAGMALLISDSTGIPIARLIGPGAPLEAAVAPAKVPAERWSEWTRRLDQAQATTYGLLARRTALREILANMAAEIAGGTP